MARFPKNKSWLGYFFLALLTISCFKAGPKTRDGLTLGIYGHPAPFWNKGYPLKNLGVNSIFVHSGSIDSAMMSRAGKEGLKVYAEFAVLNGKNYVEEHPEAWAINEKGEKVEAASWFMGVCPTEPGFHDHRLNELRRLLDRFELDGVWMDYVHWHAQFEEPEPILPETCFCSNCLKKFTSATGLKIPEGTTPEISEWIFTNADSAWRNWRCSVIADWARDIRKVMKEKKPGALLGLYHCPWDDTEFNGARRRILGLDYDTLRNIIDVFSPMVYHGRMGREPEWVGENIEWFSKRLEIRPGEFPKIWPIVQSYNDPDTISSDEFDLVMRGGLSGGSSGIMMFTSHSVAEDEKKIEVMKKIYHEAEK